jgi:hypothetical protein
MGATGLVKIVFFSIMGKVDLLFLAFWEMNKKLAIQPN